MTITPDKLLSLEAYAKIRAASRPAFIAHRRLRSVQVSHQGMADETGLSKSAVQVAIRSLLRRHLLRSRRASPTAVPEYFVLRPWIRKPG